MKNYLLILTTLFLTITFSEAKDSLRITSPISNEKFLLGSKVKISWVGIPLQDTVIIKVTSNNGNNWEVITDTATNGEYYWKIIDKSLINKYCMFTVQSKKVEDFDPMKIECRTIIKPEYYDSMFTKLEHNFVESFDIKPDGSELAIQSYETSFWDVLTGKLKYKWYDSTIIFSDPKIVNPIRTYINYNPNEKKIAILNQNLITLDLKSRSKVNSFTLQPINTGFGGLLYSPNGQMIVLDSSTGNSTHRLQIYFDSNLQKQCSFDVFGG